MSSFSFMVHEKTTTALTFEDFKIEVLNDYKLVIPLVSVVKNAAHKPDHFLGEQEYVELYKKEILLTNSESHRFAMSYHTQLRNKNLLIIKDRYRKQKTKQNKS